MHVGIDLGTTYSVVSKFDKETNSPVVLKNSFGKDTTPSVVCIENGEIIHGSDAKDEFAAGNYQSFAFYKTNMGDPDYIKYADGKEYNAEALSGIFLKKLIEDVSSANGVTIDSAVITVPAYFDEAKRQATINAGKMAGLNVLRIINEPTAAIIAYGLTSDNKTRNVMVYDLGGGTFDVTIAKVQGSNVTVLGTDGNHSLGGQNWDEAIKEHFFKLFSEQYGYDPREDDDKIEKEVMAASEKVKQRLSAAGTANFNVRCGGDVGNYSITREEFENLTASLIDTTGSLINNTLRALNMTWKDIDEIVLVGGSSRMPMVADYIEKQCGKRPLFNVNLDTIVSSGAAIQAELEVNAKTGQITQLRSVSKITNQSSLITISNTGIQDATSHSLGMIALDSNEKDFINSIIIPKNSSVNKEFKKTYKSNGSKIEIYVLQGEEKDPQYCSVLGKYIISGVDRGQNVTVSFSYNSNGIVEVYGTDGANQLPIKKESITQEIGVILSKLMEEKEAARIPDVEIKFVVDSSGSMCGEPLEKAKQAVLDFVSVMDLKHTYVSILDFASTNAYTCKNSQNMTKIREGVISLGNVGGGTNGPLAVHGGDYYRKDTVKIIVVLTDGAWFNASTEEVAAQRLKKDGFIIYAIGFGAANENFLNNIASEKGARKIDLSKLQSTFKEIASTIATEVSSGGLLKRK